MELMFNQIISWGVQMKGVKGQERGSGGKSGPAEAVYEAQE